MKTFLTLKNFLSLDDTAKYLSMTFEDEISIIDLLEAAQEGILQLSINFKQSVPLKPTQLKVPTKADVERMKHIYADKSVITPDLRVFTEESDQLIYLNGIFDIPLLINSTVANQILEFKLKQINAPNLISEKPFSFVVSRDQQLFKIVTRYRNISDDGAEYIETDDFEDDSKFVPKHFESPFELPEDSTLGMTRSNIDLFVNSISDKIKSKKAKRDRGENAKVNTSLLVIVASLLRDNDIDLESLSVDSTRNLAAGKILEKIELIGCKMDVGTIKARLKEIAEAIERREV
ncbi:hypothetical protein INP77_07625 [Methylophilus sp. 13]|uniref:hypothetical protein n=1 Tax=Methylophilus sp. 13 TaxID=2781018 RepID=UPI00188E377B|nr:hypothetical protein [Methylophilus sp. 13]MBF5039357.1 hypothetical protein [Methylophilus sp. 13]